MKEIILAFFLGAIFGGIVSWIRFKYFWLNQKKLEQKFKTLDEAIKALTLFERDVFDQKMENIKLDHKAGREGGNVNGIELSQETDVLIKTVLAKTKTLYPERTYQYLYSIFKTRPNGNDSDGKRRDEFIRKRETAIDEMSKDIHSNISSWFSTIIWQLYRDRSKIINQ